MSIVSPSFIAITFPVIDLPICLALFEQDSKSISKNNFGNDFINVFVSS